MKTNQKYNISDDLIVINPNNIQTVPLFCPVCGFPLEHSDDVKHYKEYNKCFVCVCKNIDINSPPEKLEQYLASRVKTLQTKQLIIN